MLAQVLSGAVLGVDAYFVRVEVDLGRGLPCINVVGLPESAVREGRERVLAALHNEGFEVPPKRITINLAPADIPKAGSAFDLPVALGILAAAGYVASDALSGMCIVGELGLDGTVRPVRGVLSIAARCRAEAIGTLLCPPGNAGEASVVEGLRVLPVRCLAEAVEHLRGSAFLSVHPAGCTAGDQEPGGTALDFSDVKGQETAKRALEIAAAGAHNVLMIGPPGSGKSMLARRLSSILPPLRHDEAIEVTKIYSVAGALPAGRSLITARPFRAPHHTVSDAGLVGGGSPPRPGEASLAHGGVLFLDELPEYRRNALEAMRQPLEEGVVRIGRVRISLSYPARFMLIAAMNPCPCGFRGTTRCVCTPAQVQRYVNRLSGPLLDRIDLHVEVPALDGERLTDARRGEPAAAIRERVIATRERQLQRFGDSDAIHVNADMGARELRAHCAIDPAGENLLRGAVRRLGLSARAYHRILRVARTIADLEPADRIATAHIAEAIQYRSLDRPRF